MGFKTVDSDLCVFCLKKTKHCFVYFTNAHMSTNSGTVHLILTTKSSIDSICNNKNISFSNFRKEKMNFVL